jgi:hypothetical protein
MATAAKPVTMTHGEVIDVHKIMDGLCSIDNERDCTTNEVKVTLDTGKRLVLKYTDDDGFEVSLG